MGQSGLEIYTLIPSTAHAGAGGKMRFFNTYCGGTNAQTSLVAIRVCVCVLVPVFATAFAPLSTPLGRSRLGASPLCVTVVQDWFGVAVDAGRSGALSPRLARAPCPAA